MNTTEQKKDFHGLEFQYLDVEALKPYEKNARKHKNLDVDAIVKSIEQFGFSDPIGIWSEENLIVEGHGRLMAAKKLGMKQVPCIRLDHLSDEERRAYALAHNRTAELSEWDIDLQVAELKDITDIDMTQFGFELIDDKVAVEDDFDPEPPEEPISKRGDVWLLGNHRLMCGDATVYDDLNKLCNGREVDLYVTDPPYNVDYGEGERKIMNDKMEDENFRTFLRDTFSNAKMCMKGGAAFYIWHADSEGYNFRGACRDIGWQVRECLIWSKDMFVLGRQDYQWQHEPCLYGWNEGDSHAWYSDRKQSTILHFDRPKKSKEHPTMKPIPLFDYLIQNSSKKGDIVLDTFGGSGTTMMACEQNGRTAYLMELDPKYVDVIVKRWEEFTGRKAVLDV